MCKTRGSQIVLLLVTVMAMFFPASLPAFGQLDRIPPGYPQSLHQELEKWLVLDRNHLEDSEVLRHLSEVYLNLGDDLYEKEEERVRAYEAGTAAAERFWKKNPNSPEAHFLYAANLGSLSQLKGLAFGAVTLNDIRKHLEWTLRLDPEYAPALQFLGGLSAELPWMLGGDEGLAEEYLKKAIQIDGNFTNARIILARLLIKQNRIPEARTQLTLVIHAESPHYPYTWKNKFLPEAQRLLQNLERSKSF